MQNDFRQTADLLLIRPNDQKAVYSGTASLAACEPPFWIATMAAYLKGKGIDGVKVIDAEAMDQSPEETAALASEMNPALIGLIVTGTNLSASTQKMHGAGVLAREIKKHMSAGGGRLFMWGLHPSSLPEQTLREEMVDYVIKGESLSAIEKLTRFCAGEDVRLDEIEGLYYGKGDCITGNPSIILTDINEMPAPDRTTGRDCARPRKEETVTGFLPQRWAARSAASFARFPHYLGSTAYDSRSRRKSSQRSTIW